MKSREEFEKYHKSSALCPKCLGKGEIKNDKFISVCGQCNGWGYVEAGSLDATCIHEYSEMTWQECKERGIYHGGNCYHVIECAKCKQVSAYDSSD